MAGVKRFENSACHTEYDVNPKERVVDLTDQPETTGNCSTSVKKQRKDDHKLDIQNTKRLIGLQSLLKS